MIVFDILAAVWLFSAANGLLLEALDLSAGRLGLFDRAQGRTTFYHFFTSPPPHS